MRKPRSDFWLLTILGWFITKVWSGLVHSKESHEIEQIFQTKTFARIFKIVCISFAKQIRDYLFHITFTSTHVAEAGKQQGKEEIEDDQVADLVISVETINTINNGIIISTNTTGIMTNTRTVAIHRHRYHCQDCHDHHSLILLTLERISVRLSQGRVQDRSLEATSLVSTTYPSPSLRWTSVAKCFLTCDGIRTL